MALVPGGQTWQRGYFRRGPIVACAGDPRAMCAHSLWIPAGERDEHVQAFPVAYLSDDEPVRGIGDRGRRNAPPQASASGEELGNG